MSSKAIKYHTHGTQVRESKKWEIKKKKCKINEKYEKKSCRHKTKWNCEGKINRNTTSGTWMSCTVWGL